MSSVCYHYFEALNMSVLHVFPKLARGVCHSPSATKTWTYFVVSLFQNMNAFVLSLFHTNSCFTTVSATTNMSLFECYSNRCTCFWFLVGFVFVCLFMLLFQTLLCVVFGLVVLFNCFARTSNTCNTPLLMYCHFKQTNKLFYLVGAFHMADLVPKQYAH